MKHIMPIFMLGLAVGACGDRTTEQLVPEDIGERYADVLCPAVQGCGCGRFESIDACRSHVVAEFNMVRPDLRNFDEACFEAHMNSGAYDGCLGPDEAAALLPDCQVFAGSAALGEPCKENRLFGQMNPRGTCVDVACQPITGTCLGSTSPPTKQLGDACSDQLDDNCYDADLYCHVDECRSNLAVGDACGHIDACGLINFCAGLNDGGQGVCTEPLPLGSACSPDDWDNCEFELGSYPWCDPATNVCETPIPYVCLRLLGSTKPGQMSN